MAAKDGIPRGLPEQFVDSDKSYSLYEGVNYEEYWEEPGQSDQDALEQWLISDLLPGAGQRIVDVGCGYGRLAPCYLDRFDQAVIVDGSLSLLRQARRSLGARATVVAADITRLPFKPASFDNVLTIRVLQHMQDLPAAIASLRRVLAESGQLTFSYHNKRNANRILHYMKSRRISDPFSLDSAEVSPTLISHHPRRMAELLDEADFGPPDYVGAVVLGPVAKMTASMRGDMPSGLRWASFTGRHALAPWLIGKAQTQNGDALLDSSSVEDLFECPACGGEPVRSASAITCGSCSREYPIRDGIYDFRL